jgi:hypothetical protein
MLLASSHNSVDLGSIKRFCRFIATWPVFVASFASFSLVVLIVLVLSAGLAFAQQGSSTSGNRRPQANPGPLPPQGKSQPPPADVKKSEIEERRRLRQEIRRQVQEHKLRDSNVGAIPRAVVPPVVSTPALPPAPAVVPSPVPAPAPAPASAIALPPSIQSLPSYFGPPVLPPSQPNSSSSNGRVPALSIEERQQLRKQIREERQRGLYTTPSEVER